MRLGYKLMSEEHGPRALVRNAGAAERAGFDFVALSDHFQPWIEAQGHSPYAWSVLGAIAACTERIGIATAVTCPFLRYHPAIVAQKAATLALLSRGRFVLGVGTGEALNERVVAGGWPPVEVRQEMLEESVEILRRLFEGGRHSFQGRHVQLERGRLYDLPDTPPPIVVAAGGPQAARLAAEVGDGMIATEPDPELVESYRAAGGDGPRYAEVALCYAADEESGLKTAHELGRWMPLGWKVLPEIPEPRGFEQATKSTRPADLADAIAAGPDVERHVQAVQRYLDAGFDHLVLLQIGSEQQRFVRFFEEELGPRLREGR